MALTPAEKQRRYRERKEAKLAAEAESAGIFIRPFSDFYADNWNSELEFYFDVMGFKAPDFDDDSGIKPLTESLDAEDVEKAANSLGKAEMIISCLLDAAGELARSVKQYKAEEINARIAELEARDLSDPEAKKQALADIVRLTKYRDQLEKQVRWSLPQWKVKGE
jgi:hypothetical protein